MIDPVNVIFGTVFSALGIWCLACYRRGFGVGRLTPKTVFSFGLFGVFAKNPNLVERITLFVLTSFFLIIGIAEFVGLFIR